MYFLMFIAVILLGIYFYMKNDETTGGSTNNKSLVGICGTVVLVIAVLGFLIISFAYYSKLYNKTVYYMKYNDYKLEKTSVYHTDYKDVWAIEEEKLFDKNTLKKCTVYTVKNAQTKEEVLFRSSKKDDILKTVKTYYLEKPYR